MGKKPSRSTRKRELSRDEVFVGGSELPTEWARDDAFVMYRVYKAAPWLTYAYIATLVLLVPAFLMQSPALVWLIAANFLLLLAMLGAAYSRRRR